MCLISSVFSILEVAGIVLNFGNFFRSGAAFYEDKLTAKTNAQVNHRTVLFRLYFFVDLIVKDQRKVVFIDK